MALKDIFKNISGKHRQWLYAKFLNGYYPVFTQFGTNIYASDIVQNCIDIIATEIGKLQPKHIRTDSEGMQKIPKSSINRLFKFKPNPYMTTKDFLEKIIWLLYMNYNCFIYPTTTYENGIVSYSGFYPLNPVQVDFLQDADNTLYIRLHFRDGNNYTIPYSDIIHLRKKYSVNDIMGGGMDGKPDNTALLKLLDTDDVILQGLGKAIKTSLSIKGILSVGTLANDKKLDEEKSKFEAAVKSGDTALLPIDLKGTFTPVTIDPKVIDKETMDFVQNRILNWFGVSVPILMGKFSDEDYQAFYERTLESIIISLGQAFSKCLFTDRELDFGNEIVFYQKNMMYLSTKSKIELIKIAGEQGLLNDNQKLALLGYPPIKGGDRITQSLNYIDRSIINTYQLNKLKSGGKEE